MAANADTLRPTASVMSVTDDFGVMPTGTVDGMVTEMDGLLSDTSIGSLSTPSCGLKSPPTARAPLSATFSGSLSVRLGGMGGSAETCAWMFQLSRSGKSAVTDFVF